MPSREDKVNPAGTQVLESLQTVPSARNNQERVDNPTRVNKSRLIGWRRAGGEGGLLGGGDLNSVLKEGSRERNYGGGAGVRCFRVESGVCSMAKLCQGELLIAGPDGGSRKFRDSEGPSGYGVRDCPGQKTRAGWEGTAR